MSSIDSVEFLHEKRADDDYAFIKSQMKDSGMDKYIENTPKVKRLLNHIENDCRNIKFYSNNARDLYVYRQVVASIIKDDLIWLARWVTDNRNEHRIERVHEVAWNFFKHGPSSIPDDYKRACNFNYKPYVAQYKDSSGKIIQRDFRPKLLLIPRGLAKTTIFHVLHAIYEFMRDPGSKWFMVHGDKSKAAQNLQQIKSFIAHRALVLVRPDLFSEDYKEIKDRGGQVTKEKININRMIYSELDDTVKKDWSARRESTFFIGSPGMDVTGLHPDGEFDDDLVIHETSKSAEATEQLEHYYRNNFALANTPGLYPRFLTGTLWWENSLYHKLFDEITYFWMPADWKDEKGCTVYVSNSFSEDKYQLMKDNYKEWFYQHMCIYARPYESSLMNVEFSEQEHVVSFTDAELQKLKREGTVVQVCDPAYSKKGKKVGDAKSRFTITHFIMHDDYVYIYNCFQSLGEDGKSAQELNVSMAVEHDIDFFIQDAQGTQGGLYDLTIDAISKELDHIRDFKHERSITGTEGKIAIANKVLSEYAKLGVLKVIKNESTKKVVDQLCGRDVGMDIIDTIVYLFNDVYPYRDVEQYISRSRKETKKISSRSIEKKERDLFLNNRVYKRIA